MRKEPEILCQFHNNCGGYCETPAEIDDNLCADCLDAENTDWRSPLEVLIGIHKQMLSKNPYCYFELAYTRQTKWMVWICSNSKENDINRTVIAKGQGETPNDAASAALTELLMAV